MNFALLKEEVMDFIVNNSRELLHTEVLKDAPEGLFHDALAAVARRDFKDGNDKKRMENKFGTLHISELRREAYGKGLGVDGSREALIAAIKNADIE